VLRVARQTLLDPITRREYDFKLASQQTPAVPDTLPLIPGIHIPAPISPQAIDQQIQALELKAESLQLRADAIALKAQMQSAPAHLAAAYSGTSSVALPGSFAPAPPPSVPGDLLTGSLAPFKRIAAFFGVLLMLWLVMQFAFWQRASTDQALQRMDQQQNTKAQERAILEEHYQTYGERPATVEEAKRLAAAHRQRAQLERDATRKAEDTQRAEKEFLEESRRRGEEVARQLEIEQERARLAGERLDAEEKLQKIRDKERKEREDLAERERIAKEQKERQEFLRRPLGQPAPAPNAAASEAKFKP
jgi:DNA repair exonuclease SbcCD ATPase subunit